MFLCEPCSSPSADWGLVSASLWSYLPEKHIKQILSVISVIPAAPFFTLQNINFKNKSLRKPPPLTNTQMDQKWLYKQNSFLLPHRLQASLHEHQQGVDAVHVDPLALLWIWLQRHRQQHIETLQRKRWQQVHCVTAGVREGHGKGVSVDRRERGKPIPCSAFPCFFLDIYC